MTRREWWRCLAAGGLALAATAGSRSVLAEPQVATLNETLRSVLKCRRPEEFAFVDLVATKVQQGRLPLPLVLGMMKWAVKRREDIPFPYFQEGIKRQAAALGVEL